MESSPSSLNPSPSLSRESGFIPRSISYRSLTLSPSESSSSSGSNGLPPTSQGCLGSRMSSVPSSTPPPSVSKSSGSVPCELTSAPSDSPSPSLSGSSG